MNRRFNRQSRFATVMVVALLTVTGGCGGDAESREESSKTVYVCSETGQVVVAAPQEAPAVNPETGRRTLMPGLYCTECEKWHPSPPPEVLQRQPGAGMCPVHSTPLASEGPLP